MKRQIVLLIFLGSQWWACQNPGSTSGSTDLDATELREELLKVFEQNRLMGMSVLVIAKGNIAWEGTYGLADSSRQIPVRDNTIYRIASISKSLTATALLQLWEQGKVDLNADVSQYLGWPLRHPGFPQDTISLLHLLNHRSGIRDGNGYREFSRDMIEQKLDIRELFLPEGAYFSEDMFSEAAPGNFFSYTNSTWGVIASIIEKVSGERFDVYCRKNIFAPLGIEASFNVLDIQNLDRLAVLYRFRDGKWVAQADDYKGKAPESRVDDSYQLGRNGLIFGPQGSLRSSAKDLATFALMLMNGGEWQGNRILKKETIDLMTSNQWSYNGGNGDTWSDFFLSYGLGIHRTTNRDSSDIIFPDRKMLGHPGIAYGLLSDLYFDPVSQSGIVFITNGSKEGYGYGRKTTFYQVEEDVFETVFPILKKMEK